MTGNIDLDNKVKELQKDRDTTEWLATIGSESVKINYLKHLAEYLAYRNISIKILIENLKKDMRLLSRHETLEEKNKTSNNGS